MASAALALADSVTLKSGEVINGKILRETDTQVVMEVAVTASIKDEKIIPKADVQTVSKTAADEIAYQAIKPIQPGANSFDLEKYAPLTKSLEAFLAQYPQSARVKDVQATLAAFKDEQARVKAGDVKFSNRWYTAKEAEKNKYHLAGQKLLVVMREQAVRRDFVGALNTYADIEKTYPNSSAFPEASALAQNMIATATADIERLRDVAKMQDEQFNKGLLFVGESEKKQMQAARKAQLDNAEAQYAAAERSTAKWKPLMPLVDRSFDNLKSALSTEGPRIDKLPVADMRKSVAATTEAEAEMTAKHFANADAKLKEAKALWAKNERSAVLTAELAVLKSKASSAPGALGTAADASASDSSDQPAAPKATPTPTPKKMFGIF